ncbi:hypothetical protein [Natronorubrum tibetense]|uniref:Uncharacterized protein n=1 Tax=Natronorubrum tibetense GA33 TaxID=1114856 RepID=L9VDW6_9EURY|nr:hypothetical protein [Natronorubrum tibetense]ELY35241.1 hypothetical protein C496_23703 [Natronorubrum tibetense GA33]
MPSSENDDRKRERTLEDVLKNPADDLESTVFLWLTPDDMDDSIPAVRRASLVSLVARDGDRLLVEAREGEDIGSLVEFEGRENVELAYGSRDPTRSANIFERVEIAERDLERPSTGE